MYMLCVKLSMRIRSIIRSTTLSFIIIETTWFNNTHKDS